MAVADFFAQLRYDLVFFDNHVTELLLLDVVFFLVRLCDLIDEHLPFVFVDFLEQLLVDAHRTDEDVFLFLGAPTALFNRIVEAHRVHIQSSLQAEDLLL